MSSNNKKFKKLLSKNINKLNYENTEIRILCKSEKLYNVFAKYKTDNLLILNEVYSMDQQLDWADVFITKTGGLSVAEAISKKVVLLLYLIIKANEEDNSNYVVSKGFGMSFRNYQQLFSYLIKIIKQPSLLDKYSLSLKETNYNNACEFVYNAMS